MKKATYDTNLTDAQWAYLQPLLPQPAKLGRPPTDRRRILEAILYLVKCGCPWRYLPADFPHWKTVYHVFRQWIANHCWVVIHDTLRVLVRHASGKRSRPTAAILDSQTVKSAGHGGQVGYDAAKRIKGRKRHLLVDTLGLIMGVAVTPADTTERDGAQLLLGRGGGTLVGWLGLGLTVSLLTGIVLWWPGLTKLRAARAAWTLRIETVPLSTSARGVAAPSTFCLAEHLRHGWPCG